MRAQCPPVSVIPTAAVLVAVLVLSWQCTERGESLFEDAERAHAAEEVDAAASLYREVTILSPDSPLSAIALYELARIAYFHRRDLDEARDDLIKILAEYPSTDAAIPARRLLARLYEHDLQDTAKALVHYEILLASDTDPDVRRTTLLAIGNCYYRLDDHESAAEAYRGAIALPYHPDSDAAYFRLANIAWLTREPGTALRYLREVERRTGDYDRRHDAIMSEVELLMSLGRFKEARERLRDGEALFPDSPDVDELQSRLHEAEVAHRSLDGASGEALLQELQKKIRWGGGRRRRARNP